MRFDSQYHINQEWRHMSIMSALGKWKREVRGSRSLLLHTTSLRSVQATWDSIKKKIPKTRWWTILKRREFSVHSDEQSQQILITAKLVPSILWKKHQDWINPKWEKCIISASCLGLFFQTLAGYLDDLSELLNPVWQAQDTSDEGKSCKLKRVRAEEGKREWACGKEEKWIRM